MGDTSAAMWTMRRCRGKETTQVQARVRFIEEWLAKEYESLAVLCRVHGVSRKTGYKWVGRFKEGGRPALNDRPKRWRSHPHTTARDVVELVVGARNANRRGGLASCRRGSLGAVGSAHRHRQLVRF
jgi:leucine-zipper of insertion element IS481